MVFIKKPSISREVWYCLEVGARREQEARMTAPGLVVKSVCVL